MEEHFSGDTTRISYNKKTNLLSQGVRYDLDLIDVKLWLENYLRDTGLSKETARRWLSRYNSETELIFPYESEGNGK